MPLLPQNDPQRPSYASDQASIWREIRALWKNTKLPTSYSASKEAIFSYFGAPVVGTVSPPYLVQNAYTFTYMTVAARTAGTTDSVVTIYKNSASVSTVTLPANQLTANSVIAVDCIEGDAISVAVTTVGTSVADITIQVLA